MVKDTQIICWMLPTNCLSVFDNFVVLTQRAELFSLPNKHLSLVPTHELCADFKFLNLRNKNKKIN